MNIEHVYKHSIACTVCVPWIQTVNETCLKHKIEPTVMSTRSRQPRKSTNTAFPRLTHVPRTRRRIAPPPLRFLASSRPFYYILQHLYISIPLPKYPPSLHSQRAHRFADARPFVTLLYLDARIRSRTAFAAFDSFYSTFTSHLCSRTGSPFYSTCLHTFYIQIMTHKLAIKTL